MKLSIVPTAVRLGIWLLSVWWSVYFGHHFRQPPCMVMRTDMTYLQMCIGFILGYFRSPFFCFLSITGIISLRFTVICSSGWVCFYMELRFSSCPTRGAAVRFFVVCILGAFRARWDLVPFWVTVPVMVLLIWLYTRKGGIKTLVWTDTLPDALYVCVLHLICQVSALGMTPSEAITAIVYDSHSRIFVFDDWMSKQNFWSFLSALFVVIVMTGLDQDMMVEETYLQLLREAQKDVCSYGFAFVPAQFLSSGCVAGDAGSETGSGFA